MSVTFFLGARVAADLERRKRWMNLSNRNAADLHAWLGLPTDDLYGLPARQPAARCHLRLWPEGRNVDPEVREEHAGHCQVFGRPVGYRRTRTGKLLCLAELAGDDLISWA